MLLQKIRDKMVSQGIPEHSIKRFLTAVDRLVQSDIGTVSESSIDPVRSLPKLEEFGVEKSANFELLSRLAVVKVNGGLGTGMALDRAKSLLPVRRGRCLLDFIALHILHLRERTASKAPAFYLMNSLSTQEHSRQYLRKYPSLYNEPVDFLQGFVPRLCEETYEPISWPTNRKLEWCPPGHGDLYTSIFASGLLDNLLRAGIKFMFVSNSDNVGASVSPAILRYFSDSGISFLMEVTKRTATDRKGGHIAQSKRTQRLLLRELAQCPDEDMVAFQDTERHRYFNTNNLWVRLDHLKETLDSNGGVLPLPVIVNRKTVDPNDTTSPKILQLESAMGAAIECFDRADAIVVPRTRFIPVKTTSDLMALRSDAYYETENGCLALELSRGGRPPLIDLSQEYKHIADFEAAFPRGVPSLLNCNRLKISGKWVFDADVACEGDVEFINPSPETKRVTCGTYRGNKRFSSPERVAFQN